VILRNRKCSKPAWNGLVLVAMFGDLKKLIAFVMFYEKIELLAALSFKRIGSRHRSTFYLARSEVLVVLVVELALLQKGSG
jgi:hypothetical protein